MEPITFSYSKILVFGFAALTLAGGSLMSLAYQGWHNCTIGFNGAGVGYVLPRWYCGTSALDWHPFVQMLYITIVGVAGLAMSLTLFHFTRKSKVAKEERREGPHIPLTETER